MRRLLTIVSALLALNACAAKDARYYHLNPIALQQALKDCPQKQPQQVSCVELDKIALDVNQLAYQLKMNPQGFGTKILTLQNELVKQQQELQKNPKETALVASIENNQWQLAQYLAVVKWLESPES